MKVLFLCPPSRAFGEINTLVPLARGINDNGGEVWFLASPLAVEVARLHFPTQCFAVSACRQQNKTLLLRLLKKFRPDALVFSEFYEIIRPRRRPDCPLIDAELLRALNHFDCMFAFVDFIAHAPFLREIARRPDSASDFGGEALIEFLSRLWTLLPCPLNDPGPIEGRCGIPYRSLELPRKIAPRARAQMRARFMSKDAEGFLVVRTGSTWQTRLAEKLGVGLYGHLGELFAYYLSGLPRPVTLISVSSAHRIDCGGAPLQIHNISNLPPREFEQLVLAADLVFTDNEIAYTLCTTIGRVPGVTFVNSGEPRELLSKLGRADPVRHVVVSLERSFPGSVYPFKIFPIRASKQEFHEAAGAGTPSDPLRGARPSYYRLGRLYSSPFTRAEIFGGEVTRQQIHGLLCDSRQRALLREDDNAFIRRLNQLDDGPTVLQALNHYHTLGQHRVL